MRTPRICLLILLVLASSTIASPASAKQWRIRQITDNDVNDIEPDIDGHRIVWASGHEQQDFDIILYDGITSRVISNEQGFYHRQPSIDGDIVAWSNYTEGWTVSVYDGTHTFDLPKAGNGPYDHNPHVDGDRIAFHSGGDEDYDVYVYEAGTTTAVTTDSRKNVYPVISDDRLVWSRTSHFRTEIVQLQNGTVEVIASQGLPFGVESDFDGINIVWYALPAGTPLSERYWDHWEIYRFDGTASHRITSNDFTDFSAVVSGENIAWFGSVDELNKYHVYSFDGLSISTVTQAAADQRGIAIDGSTIVWSAFDGDDFEIYLATPVPEPPGMMLGAMALLLTWRFNHQGFARGRGGDVRRYLTGSAIDRLPAAFHPTRRHTDESNGKPNASPSRLGTVPLAHRRPGRALWRRSRPDSGGRRRKRLSIGRRRARHFGSTGIGARIRSTSRRRSTGLVVRRSRALGRLHSNIQGTNTTSSSNMNETPPVANRGTSAIAACPSGEASMVSRSARVCA